MDTGHTEHSGCPVREGRKWIATQWFREGVSLDETWDKVRLSETDPHAAHRAESDDGEREGERERERERREREREERESARFRAL